MPPPSERAPRAKAKPARKRIRSARRAARKKKPTSYHMVRKVRARAKNKPSGLELKVRAWLDDMGVDYEAQFRISRCHVDFYFPATKTVVEVQGCYWHGHKECYGR